MGGASLHDCPQQMIDSSLFNPDTPLPGDVTRFSITLESGVHLLRRTDQETKSVGTLQETLKSHGDVGRGRGLNDERVLLRAEFKVSVLCFPDVFECTSS